MNSHEKFNTELEAGPALCSGVEQAKDKLGGQARAGLGSGHTAGTR